jgi:hypothetical protein
VVRLGSQQCIYLAVIERSDNIQIEMTSSDLANALPPSGPSLLRKSRSSIRSSTSPHTTHTPHHSHQ